MKRRVLSKTTPFHVIKKKKKKRERPNGAVLNGTVPLLPFPPEPVTEEKKIFILRRKAQIWIFMDLIGFFMDLIGFLFEFIEDLIARKIDF